MSPAHKALSLLRYFFFHFVIISLLFEQLALAQALPINPDGSTDTQVTKTASGIDQVNIAAPNSSGLSHNKFTDYNVNSSGQIINNFAGGAKDITSTMIGGLVTANPNLNNAGSAKTILNEVTSNNVSKILGYAEIAGSKADLIIANPNGITCSGCGFINTARLLMVAGSSNFDANRNLGFDLSKRGLDLAIPLITIDDLGLDVTRVNSAEIIASSVKLISSIYGSNDTNLTIASGDKNYDYNSKKTTSLYASESDPLFAIDASALSKIEAGQIFLIATKQGVGVNMEAEILAGSEISIDANGDVYYASISSGDKANIKSSGS